MLTFANFFELPEIRAGVESGHIPHSRNLFYAETAAPDSKQYLPPAEIERKFRAKGIDLRKPIVATCGSGVSACQLALALYLTGRTNVPVYDGVKKTFAHLLRDLGRHETFRQEYRAELVAEQESLAKKGNDAESRLKEIKDELEHLNKLEKGKA